MSPQAWARMVQSKVANSRSAFFRTAIIAVAISGALLSRSVIAQSVDQDNVAPTEAQDDPVDSRESLKTGLLVTWRSANQVDYAAARQPYWDTAGMRGWIRDKPSSPDQIAWDGFLRVEQPGRYRFAVESNGRIRVYVDGQLEVGGERRARSWLQGGERELDHGLHVFRIEWEAGPVPDQPHLSGVAWQGPEFPWERIPESSWRMPKSALAERANLIREGENLIDSLRCAACHSNQDVPHPAPSLRQASATLHPDWIVARLMHMTKPGEEAEVASAMPDFGLSLEEARDVASFLFQGKAGSSSNALGAGLSESTEAGRDLLLTVGCLACHRYSGLGGGNSVVGGDLTLIGQKRPASYFPIWLRDPAHFQPQHRMPVFPLTDAEITQLTRCLIAPPADAKETEAARWLTPDRVERGEKRFHALRCARCHTDHKNERSDLPSLMVREIDSHHVPACWRDSTESAMLRHGAPRYGLAAVQREAIRVAWSARPDTSRPYRSMSDHLSVRGCLACHSRGTDTGLHETVQQVSQRFAHLAPRASSMLPPALDYTGAKLREDVLVSAMQGQVQVRPYLAVRMPRYPWRSDELKAAADRWQEEDRWGEQLDSRPPFHASQLHGAAAPWIGARLVTSNGFGCASCHSIGKSRPVTDSVGAMGPQLSGVSQRVRPEWFVRWLDQPNRMNPRMEMPAVRIPILGLLQDHLPTQLEALWRVLEDPHFDAPRPNPYSVLRHNGRQWHDRVVVISDLVRLQLPRSDESASPQDKRERSLVHAHVFGLGNRHNLLYDMEHGTLFAGWIGDVATQWPDGKKWFWEVPHPSWMEPHMTPEFRLMPRGETSDTGLAPVRRGQFISELDQLEHVSGGIQFEHRLLFEVNRRTVTIPVRQTFRPWQSEDGRSRGWIRNVEAENIPSEWELELRVPTIAGNALAHGQITMMEGPTPTPAWARGTRVDGGVVAQDAVAPSEAYQWRMRFESSQLPDSYPQNATLNTPPTEVESLPIAPGFDAVRLPLTDAPLPTAFAWGPDKRTWVASLDGRIAYLEDGDRDGIEETVHLAADRFSAPFGMYAGPDYIDVLHKPALVRLRDRDGDGFWESTKTLVSGWGHTDDYHDWAVGLPRDPTGNYYLGTGCQMDARSDAAAQWRGSVLKLIPREPTSDNPHQFDVLPISRGHRYPMGIALQPDGTLVVTDNQGNYNPFNELNEVRPDANFGFVNWVDRQQPTLPIAPPAINIPHPWTRSVNGITFLPNDRTAFGAYAGQLVGCEYDLQGLVRMSLQRVRGILQGAVYPLTRSMPGTPRLLGALSSGVSPRGEVYIGSLRESGWGAGNNVGEIVKMQCRPEHIPAGISLVEVVADGFCLTFSRPVLASRAANRDAYRMESFTRVASPEYGGTDQQRRQEKIQAVKVSPDARQVWLRLESLRPGFVYEFHLSALVDEDFFPAEAYYTLHEIPSPTE